jgi:hypothetical protein
LVSSFQARGQTLVCTPNVEHPAAAASADTRVGGAIRRRRAALLTHQRFRIVGGSLETIWPIEPLMSLKTGQLPVVNADQPQTTVVVDDNAKG